MEQKREELYNLLKKSKNIAVVGISSKPFKISRMIAEYLVDKGFNVAGVNPAFTEAGSIKVYPSLKDVPFEIDIINVFRRPETIGEIIPDVLGVKPGALWLQLGIKNDEAVAPVIEANIMTVQDECIKIVYDEMLY